MRSHAILWLACAQVLCAAAPLVAAAHESGKGFAAGEPGDAKRPVRVVEIVMSDADGKMAYQPDRLEFRRGDQIKFVIRNRGALEHEFVLGDKAENQRHAAMMAEMPDMKHNDPNATTVGPGQSSTLVWRFSRKGEFEFACLIAGHYELGMHGVVEVK